MHCAMQRYFFLLVISMAIWLLFKGYEDSNKRGFIRRHSYSSQSDVHYKAPNVLFGAQGYLESGPRCHIPELDIYDPSIKMALSEEIPKPLCEINSTGILVKSNTTHLYLDQEAIARLNLTGVLSCCYRPFWRVMATSREFDENVDSMYNYSSKCVPLWDEPYLELVEFVRVECSLNGKPFYKDFYSFIPTAYRQRANKVIAEKNVSVLILGLAAVSRLNFRRQMNYTHRFLADDIRAVEFLGYHIVGDNAFPNLMPVLTGLTENEIRRTCWRNTTHTFDKCSFIWKNYKEAGFVTGYGEDASWIGLFNSQTKFGFREQPTDIYLRTFNYVCEKEMGRDNRENVDICLGPKFNVEAYLDSVSKFTLRLDQKLSFGFFWENSLSHDYLNLPNYGDKLHVSLLKEFLKKGIFNRSVVIVMSDHGMKWGKIRTTYQGYIEERLPLLTISCPTWFHRKFPLAMANLKRNVARLTTPFDLHETLKDFINISVLENDKIGERSTYIVKKDGEIPRGISLFLPIPKERTCRNAGINNHWCVCHKDEQVDINSREVVKSAHVVIDYINSFIMGFSQCIRLSLKSVISARVKVLSREQSRELKVRNTWWIKDYKIRVKAEPGGGIFEATVQHHPAGYISIEGPVSRNNSYGKSSHCIADNILKLYCFCLT